MWYLRQKLSVMRDCISQHAHLQLSSETSWQLEVCASVWSSAGRSSPSTALQVRKRITMHACSGLEILIMAVHTTIRVSSNTLKEDCSDSITEWTIHHTSVTSYPTQVCHTSKDVSWLKVKDELHRKISCVHRTITIVPTLSAYTLCTIRLQSKFHHQNSVARWP